MATDFISKYEYIWGNNPQKLLDEYNYQRELTAKLDALKPNDLDFKTFYEIVLWKLNRFPRLQEGLLEELKEVGTLEPMQHREAEATLRKMLKSPGIALPMASTILRFLRPSVFQIIDDRVYRLIFPAKAKFPAKRKTMNKQYLVTSSDIYFDYLDELHKLSSINLPFEKADRILYELDIRLGNKIGDKT